MAERCLRSRLEIGARRMPLYFFDLLSAEGLAPDEEGTELSSLDEIQNEAAYALADMLRDEVRATNGNPCWRSDDRRPRQKWSGLGGEVLLPDRARPVGMPTSFSVSDRAADGSFWPQQTFTAILLRTPFYRPSCLCKSLRE